MPIGLATVLIAASIERVNDWFSSSKWTVLSGLRRLFASLRGSGFDLHLVGRGTL